MDDELFEQLKQGVREMVAVERGEIEPGRITRLETPDAGAVRVQLELTQAQFAAMLGVSKRTLESWEQGKRTPTGSARTLLLVAARHPAAVLEAVRSSRHYK